jgi:hypothetical protein
LVKEHDFIYLSGQAMPNTTAPVDVCRMRFNKNTGDYELKNSGTNKFQVNMTNGIISQNGSLTWNAFTVDAAFPWLFAFNSSYKTTFTPGPAGTTAGNLPAKPDSYIQIKVDGQTKLIPIYNAP